MAFTPLGTSDKFSVCTGLHPSAHNFHIVPRPAGSFNNAGVRICTVTQPCREPPAGLWQVVRHRSKAESVGRQAEFYSNLQEDCPVKVLRRSPGTMTASRKHWPT